MEKNERTLMQTNALQKLLSCNNLLLKWGTGIGKSKVAILAFHMLISQFPNNKYLLVIAERAHRKNWREESVKTLGEKETDFIFSHLTVICYASLHKYEHTKWHMICFDEVQHIQSEKRQKILKTLHSEYVLALSATPGKIAMQVLKDVFGTFETDACSLQKAINKNFLSEPLITVYSLKLNNTVQDTELIIKMNHFSKTPIHDVYKNRWKYLKNRKAYLKYVLILKCTEQEKYDYINEQYDYYRNQYLYNWNLRAKNKFLRCASKRKAYLGEIKTKKVKTLIDKLKEENNRFICFCTTIKQAESLGAKNAIHSKRTDSLNLIQQFNEKKINSLFAVGMLIEGQNLEDLDEVVIIQLDVNERQFIQKVGRAMRSKYPHIHIFYYRNTRDEELYKEAIENINKDYIKYENSIEL